MSFKRVIHLFLISATIVAMNVNGNWSSEEAQTRKHIVRSGETLSIIARNYGFELQELIQYNKLENPTRLEVGQILYFPEELKPGESLPLIAPAQPSQPLNATHFPPSSAKPSPEEYFQLQQYMTTQGGIKPTNDVDYNYPQKEKSLEPEPSLHQSLMENNDADMDSSMDSTEEAEEKKTEEEDSSEETIGDKDSPALAAFGDRPYAYFGGGENLVDVIQNFAASYYVPTIIAEDVFGEVNGKIGPLTPVDFLDHMANIYGFIWYFDGHTLYVYNGNASTQKIISLNYLTVEKFKSTLKTVGIWDGRFFWKSQPKEGLVFVSGPPRYVELVAQTSMLLDKKEGDRQKNKLTVRMFRLKYAWATDKSFPYRGQEVTIPGVASILQSIIRGGGVAQVSKSSLPSPTVAPAKSVTQSGENKVTNGVQAVAQGGLQALNDGAEAEAVYINADPRLNAIIVHDLESKMVMYQELIDSLDKPTSQIEISVSIIDIDTDKIDALGIDWNNGDTTKDFSFTPLADKLPSYSTIVQSSIGSFNARVNLLAQEGTLKVISKPSILTLDNLEAVLDSSSTFYVSVASNEDAELFPVTAGTVVQVTPRIVREDVKRRIHMSINIQDGTSQQANGATLPSVKNSSINTQAIVNESESLLVGGFYKETEDQFSTKVPVLGDIPMLGGLFQSEKTKTVKQVRLFLISPRIVGLESS
ncbi:EscC/YscC/HrcC family type III secretion system outer membrane ring protein [Endozoicomonas sp. (ex Bugula neritina AB1)]|nr:EscC/YscC/HrcC family type III secretion system outer membrane ring protein [Endozoicomonas sp. (ex Bugula neritina AB1)]